MINNKVKSIVFRVNAIDDQYKKPLPEKSLREMAKICPFSVLPQDFTALNKICRCDFFRFFDFYNFENQEGVIDETLYYRKNYNLPDNYLVLFSDDVSFVLLKITSKDKSEVIWCNYMDFFNLCAGNPFNYKVTIFSSFAEFYEFLLDEEEKIRAEERG